MSDQASQGEIPETLPSDEYAARNELNEQWAGQKFQRQAYQRAPFKTWLYMVGLLLILFSATMLPPMAVAWWYDGGGVVLPFAETLGTTLGLGLLCWLPVCRFKLDLRNRDGFILVVAFWVLSSLLGALPFILSDQPQVRFVERGVRNCFRLDYHRRDGSFRAGYDAQSDCLLPGAITFSGWDRDCSAGSGLVADVGDWRHATLPGVDAWADER